MQKSENTIDLGHVSVAHYQSSTVRRGVLALGLSNKVYNWLKKPARLRPMSMFVSNEMFCIQLQLAGPDEPKSYIVSKQQSKTLPWRCAITSLPGIMPDNIPLFKVVQGVAVGTETDGGILSIALPLSAIGPLKPNGHQDAEQEIERAIQTMQRHNLPARTDVVVQLKRHINYLADMLDLELSINNDGYLEVSQIVKKKL